MKPSEPSNQIKKINTYQQQLYEDYEKSTAISLVNQYSTLLETFKEREVLKILDVGGASGYFAVALANYFADKTCKIVVIDPTKYTTWRGGVNTLNNSVLNNHVVFIEDSVENLDKYFSENTFDLIFANRAFHHFINKTWKKTMMSISDSMAQIVRALKDDGRFCITDYFYNGRIFDTSSSKIIYNLTSCKNPLLVSVFRKIESKSAGIGVCFLSKKMWLNLFDKNKLTIETTNEGCQVKYHGVKAIVYKLFLLIKNCQEDAVMILKKRI